MFLDRGVSTDDLELVREVKPCKAVLKVGDKVRINSGGAAVKVIAIDGANVTVESFDWQGNPIKEGFTMHRLCWHRATVWNWLSWRWQMFRTGVS